MDFPGTWLDTWETSGTMHLMPEENIIIAAFVAARYWPDDEERAGSSAEVVSTLRQALSQVVGPGTAISSFIIEDAAGVDDLPASAGLGILVPMSGAVQPWMERAAGFFRMSFIVPAYMQAVFPEPLARRALERNSAPASMDLYAVIKRNGGPVRLVRSATELAERVSAWSGVQRLQGTRLLLVGKPEPWVISVSRRYSDYESAFGVSLETVDQDELKRRFEATADEEAEAKARAYAERATELVEPDFPGLVEASRLVVAVERLMEETQASGLAVACFNLIGILGTTSCLAVSMLNDSPRWIGACEGDLDSALTLMLVKMVTGRPGWIANPNLQGDDTINFVHCTSALHLGGGDHAFRLRSHHESGQGVSPEVELPVDEEVTLVRFGMEEGKLTVQRGRALEPAREPSCRTQLRVDVGGLDGYLREVLGCHQVLVYGDIRSQMRYAAELLGIETVEPDTSVGPGSAEARRTEQQIQLES